MLRADVRAERALGTAIVAVCAGLVTVACGASPSASLQLPPSPSPTSAPASPAPSSAGQPLAPLTGLPTQPSIAARPAVVLPVAGSQPEGLSDADIIYEEVASPLRYVAVFQSRQASVVGPITGTLPADGQELSVLRPLIGYDGGTASFIQVLDHTAVVDLGSGTHGSLYQEGADGPTTSTQALWDAAQSTAPPALLTYRGAQTGSKALATTGQSRPASVTIHLPGYTPQKWSFDSHADQWRQVSGGPPIAVANLIIQMVGYKSVFLSRRDGITEPSAEVIGRGSAEAFSGTADSSAQGRGGLAASGEWSKPGLRYVTNYVDAEGFPMHFQPGPTLVILAPDGTRIQTA
jgi:Protein of unknown function (DUF3048) N-terminal domain/Protein of unknown function (DUF3048) C-terminal domain